MSARVLLQGPQDGLDDPSVEAARLQAEWVARFRESTRTLGGSEGGLRSARCALDRVPHGVEHLSFPRTCIVQLVLGKPIGGKQVAQVVCGVPAEAV